MKIGATRIGKGLLAGVVPFSALALGSLVPWTLLLVTVVAVVAAVLLWWDKPARLSVPSRVVIGVLVLFLAMTILQCVPLPATLVRGIAPMNADAWARAFFPFREDGPSFHPLSLSPAATHLEVLRGVFYLAVFLGAVRVMSLDGGRIFLERVVVVATVAVALSSLAHSALHATRVFGIYEPREIYAYIPGRYGPLLNSNHLAAYMNMGACVALGAALGQRPSMPKVFAASMALLLAATSVWAASRGGTGGLVLGIGLVLALSWRLKRNAESALKIDLLLPAVVAVASAILVGLGSSDFARADLSSTDLSKFDLAKTALRLVPQAPLFGVGRGAFESVFPAVQGGFGGATYQTFTHPEDFPAQWLTEWGVVVSVLGLGALVYALRPSTVLTAARPPLGAWAAVVACVVHDIVDFHLEVPGVVALAAVCVALVTGSKARGDRPSTELERRTRFGVFALAAVGAVVALASLRDLTHTLAEDRLRIGKMAVDPTVSDADFRAALHASTERYPADAYFPLMGAVRRVDGGIVRWIGHALERNPNLGRAHLVLARSFARTPETRGAQARLEYRLAYALDAGLRGLVLAETPRLVTDYDTALEVVPEGEDGEKVLDHFADALARTKPASAALLDDELLRRNAAAIGPLKRRVRAASIDVADAKGSASWCPRETCADDGVTAAKELARRDPTSCEARVMLAELQAKTNGGRGKVVALDDLQQAMDEVENRAICGRELVRLALAYGDASRADAQIDRLVRAGCGSQNECYDLYTWAARTEESRRNVGRALVLYRRAAEAAPDHYDVVEHLGALAERTGLYGEAIDVFNQLARRHPEEPKWAQRVEELRAKALSNPTSQIAP